MTSGNAFQGTRTGNDAPCSFTTSLSNTSTIRFRPVPAAATSRAENRARSHEPLGFVGPKNNEIILGTLAFGLVETAQRVIVKQQLKERVHVTPLCLELLRHCCQDDFPLVDCAEIERAFPGGEHLGDFRCEEVLKVIADGFAHAAKLFVRLGQEAVCKVRVYGNATRSVQKAVKILHLFFEQV